MASAPFLRGKHLVTLYHVRLQDERYDDLLMPGSILKMAVTNLRNRPLHTNNLPALTMSVLSLYHSLITGSKDFPLIPFEGRFSSVQRATPFGTSFDSLKENNPLSPFLDAPAGVMVPPAGSSSSANMLTAVLPEKADLEALRADPRNRVFRMEFDDTAFIRVISTVYHTESTELTNRWRVTDYRTDGRILMSVLCQFVGQCARYAVTPEQGKRKDAEEDSSSQSPPKKRFRL